MAQRPSRSGRGKRNREMMGNSQTRLIVIRGKSGSGKSALAADYVELTYGPSRPPPLPLSRQDRHLRGRHGCGDIRAKGRDDRRATKRPKVDLRVKRPLTKPD